MEIITKMIVCVAIGFTYICYAEIAESSLDRIQEQKRTSFEWIPHARTASGVGRSILAGKYGDRYVELFKRIIARKKQGLWYVRPDEPFDEQLLTQQYEVVLEPVTGRVVEMHSYIPSLDK
jgi:hypothetical protein